MQDRIVGIPLVQVTTVLGRVIDIPVTAAGSGTLFIQTTDLDFGEPNRQKYVDGLLFDIEADGPVPTLVVDIGFRDKLRDPLVFIGEQFLNLDNPLIGLRQTAKFWVIRLEDQNPTNQWRLSSIEVYGQIMGKGRL